MLEALLIMSIVYACMFMPLRGKYFSELSEKQQNRVMKNYNRYMNTRKGKQTPNMTIEEYLPKLQQTGVMYLVMAIVIFPIYIFAVYAFYLQAFSF